MQRNDEDGPMRVVVWLMLVVLVAMLGVGIYLIDSYVLSQDTRHAACTEQGLWWYAGRCVPWDPRER